MDGHTDLNRAYWDERVAIHVRSRFYDVDGFRDGRLSLGADEVRDLGDVRGQRLAHLQCHFGLDSLSWARLGAEVSGLDFSGPAIDAARGLARETGIAARFVQADVYDAPAVLGRDFDIVYTGIGALCWLPDITRWAQAVAALLRPGGQLYLVEFHPANWGLDLNPAGETPEIRYDYFTRHDGEPVDLAGSYAESGAPTAHNGTLQWNHNMGAVITALIRAGLAIREVRESDASYMRTFPFMEQGEDGHWRVPAGRPNMPMMYTLRAVREGC
ncbi:class I SAM-dependent methyltransferase [Emcibacter sp. SYSU 3D8]|uniref:class I SAM-dependent methyltransferase n=1 Tax=Emcibacter sp. SYSU 3D8 TaxID=3133969 RepID=UPI0031FF0186